MPSILADRLSTTLRHVNRHRIVLVGLGLLVASLVPACSAPCEEMLGVFPPPVITVTGAETVEVPHIAWSCDDFHSDTIDPPPSVVPDDEGRVTVSLDLEEGSSIEVTLDGAQAVVDPAPVAGANSWTFQVGRPEEPLVVRVCSADERCAMYWANLYPSPFG